MHDPTWQVMLFSSEMGFKLHLPLAPFDQSINQAVVSMLCPSNAVALRYKVESELYSLRDWCKI